jgi:hypothetical protein
MKTSAKVIACLVCLAVLVSIPCALAQADKLVGVWRITEARLFAQPDQDQEETVIKNHRPGILIFTRNHFSWVDVHGEPAPDLPEEPDLAHFSAAFNQLTAFSGTYEANGSSITAPVIVSKEPNAMSEGTILNFEYRFEGDTLVLKLDTWNLEFKMRRLE